MGEQIIIIVLMILWGCFAFYCGYMHRKVNERGRGQ